MDSKLRKMAILASMAVILLVALAVMYVNREQLSPTSGQNTEVSGAQNAGDGEAVDPVPEGTGETDTAEADGRIGNDLKAFLKDNTFFDPDVNPILEAAKDNSHRLSLVATSVEKDLRIQIVDNEGVPVTGESFYVRVDGLGDYKDLDQDGVIYIADLDSGDYYMELLPVEGYKVPITETKVHVKEKVEYLAIDDISLLIKTEDEVDADAEDSAVAGALADADKTEIQKLQTTSGNAKVGIDVSKWNGTIDWDKVKNAGVQFAIVRAGYRGSVTGSLVEDPQFVANMKGATAAGIPVGVYFFTQATDEKEAVEEASAVLELIRDFQLTYPVFIDTEGAGGNGRADGLDAETRTLVCEAFCRTVENAGYTAGVYASRNWYNNNLQTARLENYHIWLAEYRSVPLYQGYYKTWQYTSKGKVDGIEGRVDMNITYE